MDELLNKPFGLKRNEKQIYLLSKLRQLMEHHYTNCQPYANLSSRLNLNYHVKQPEHLPFLPVSLFKRLDLYSTSQEQIVKTLTSSGTTGQQVSKIYLDKETALVQSKTLVSIVGSLLGKKRLPMIVIDSKNIIRNRQAYSARGAGIVGFSNFGRNHLYLLDDEMRVDWVGLEQFLGKHKGEPIFLFGFTFIVWQYFYKICKQQQRTFDLSKGILIHGGGWKKLEEEAVSNEVFKAQLQEQFGLSRIHNYYGMVEQVGSIFIECEHGHLHTPAFADIIVRDMDTLAPLPIKEKGLLQVLSILPKSYPGHSLLTEDLGMWLGEDDCPCGRLGKYFRVMGRLPKAELRGCSDTLAYGQRGID